MTVRQRETAAASAAAPHDAGIDLDKPIFTLSVASEILETHPRTLMMYEHLDMIRRRLVTVRFGRIMSRCSYIIRVRGCVSRISEATLSVKMGLSRSMPASSGAAAEAAAVSRCLAVMCFLIGRIIPFKRLLT